MKIIEDMKSEEYHATPAVSAGKLTAIAKSAAHMVWEIEHPKRSEDFDFGIALHCLMDGFGFDSRVAVEPKFDRRTNIGKSAAAEFEKMHAGKTIIDERDLRIINKMRDNFYAHPAAKHLLDADGKNEVSCFWTDARTKLPCKLRADRLIDGACIDWKTCADASPEGFKWAARRFRYDLRAAWYLDGLRECGRHDIEEVIFACVEKPPKIDPDGLCAVACYSLSPEDIDKGRSEYLAMLDKYAAAKASGVWSGYGNGVTRLVLPKRDWEYD